MAQVLRRKKISVIYFNWEIIVSDFIIGTVWTWRHNINGQLYNCYECQKFKSSRFVNNMSFIGVCVFGIHIASTKKKKNITLVFVPILFFISIEIIV